MPHSVVGGLGSHADADVIVLAGIGNEVMFDATFAAGRHRTSSRPNWPDLNEVYRVSNFLIRCKRAIQANDSVDAIFNLVSEALMQIRHVLMKIYMSEFVISVRGQWSEASRLLDEKQSL